MSRRGMSSQMMWLAAGVFALVVTAFGYAAWDGSKRRTIIISTDPTLVEIVVEVRGAVATPGVYRLDGDGRVGQLVELAGGVTGDADLRQVNLARRLADEELVVIPEIGAASPVASPPNGETGQVGIATRLNINTASAAELETLPGIGEVLAERIVSYRTANGPFGRVDDLGRVDGISEATIEELRELVTVGP